MDTVSGVLAEHYGYCVPVFGAPTHDPTTPSFILRLSTSIAVSLSFIFRVSAYAIPRPKGIVRMTLILGTGRGLEPAPPGRVEAHGFGFGSSFWETTLVATS